jgi:hypothetical protein
MFSKGFLDEGMEHVRERGTYNQMRSLMSNPTLLYSKYWSTMRKNVKYNYREQINNVHKCKLRPGTFITGDVHLLQLLCLYYRCDAFITGAVLLLQVLCLYTVVVPLLQVLCLYSKCCAFITGDAPLLQVLDLYYRYCAFITGAAPLLQVLCIH